MDYYLAISDIHIGHRKTSAEDLLTQLYIQFYPSIDEHCKMIILAGDTFDDLLNMNTADATVAVALIDELMKYAKRYNIHVRALRGTITHDKNQFQRILSSINKDNDPLFRFFDTVEIEYIPSEDIHILYLPDDIPFKKSEDLITHVKKLMNDIGISKINIVIGHGYFTHVLPEAEKFHNKFVYDYNDFKDIVDGPIIMGHVHTHSIYKNVVYVGSFNRLKHNEEEDKGHLFFYRNKQDAVKLKNTSGWSCRFVKNHFATLFHTEYAYGTVNDAESILPTLENNVNDFFKDRHGYLRIFVDNLDMQKLLGSKVVRLFPRCTTTVEIKKVKEDDPIPLNTSFFEGISFENPPKKETLPTDLLEYIKIYKPNTVLTEQIIHDTLEQLEKE